MRQLEEALQQVEDKCSNIAAELAIQKTDKDRLQGEHEDLGKKYAETSRKLADKTDECERLQTELEAVRTKERRNREASETTIKDLTTSCKTKEALAAELQEKILQNENAIQDLHAQIDQYSKRTQELERQAQEMARDNKQLTDDNIRLEAEAANVYNQNEAKLGELEAQCEAIRRQSTAMRTESEKQKAREAELLRQVQDAEKMKASYKEQESGLRKANKKMQKRLLEIEREVEKFAQDRENLLREKPLAEQPNEQKQLSKILVLQEVQNKIAQFKFQHQLRKSPY